MTLRTKTIWKDILFAVATLLLTMVATIGAMRLPLPPGTRYHDAKPAGWIPFFGIPVITVIVTAKLGRNWMRYTVVLLATFISAFTLMWFLFAVLARFR